MSVFTTPADPPVRENGKCANCGKRRKQPKSSYARREEFERDPFCSRPCCEAWHRERQP